MLTPRNLDETPRERLIRVASLAPPYQREFFRRNWLVAIGLLLVAFSVMLVAMVLGIVGVDLVGEYIRRLTP